MIPVSVIRKTSTLAGSESVRGQSSSTSSARVHPRTLRPRLHAKHNPSPRQPSATQSARLGDGFPCRGFERSRLRVRYHGKTRRRSNRLDEAQRQQLEAARRADLLRLYPRLVLDPRVEYGFHSADRATEAKDAITRSLGVYVVAFPATTQDKPDQRKAFRARFLVLMKSQLDRYCLDFDLIKEVPRYTQCDMFLWYSSLTKLLQMMMSSLSHVCRTTGSYLAVYLTANTQRNGRARLAPSPI
ncbi:hypothetical protein Plhal710r2_c007g0033581 [Plasmopara halstedii]